VYVHVVYVLVVCVHVVCVHVVYAHVVCVRALADLWATWGVYVHAVCVCVCVCACVCVCKDGEEKEHKKLGCAWPLMRAGTGCMAACMARRGRTLGRASVANASSWPNTGCMAACMARRGRTLGRASVANASSWPKAGAAAGQDSGWAAPSKCATHCSRFLAAPACGDPGGRGEGKGVKMVHGGGA